MRTIARWAGPLVMAWALGPWAFAQCEILRLDFPGDTTTGPKFGYSVAIDGDRLAAGNSRDGTLPLPGEVYLYERDAMGWELAATLQASDAMPRDYFGHAVALDGDRLLVGASNYGGDLLPKGRAYVFERTQAGWVQTATLENTDSLAWIFGWAVDLEGDRAVVTARGTPSIGSGRGYAYVFELSGGTWTQVAKLTPSISEIADWFGMSVDLDGDRIVVGQSYGLGGPDPGRAYVFDRDGAGTWKESAVLEPNDLHDGDYFGVGAAVDGDVVVVTNPSDDDAATNGGAAYVYEKGPSGWVQTAKLTEPAHLGALMGYRAALRGDRLLLGAPYDKAYADHGGSCTLYERSGGTWNVVANFAGSAVAAGDAFGWGLALGESELVVGAPHNFSTAPGVPHVYLYALSGDGPHLTATSSTVSLSQGGTQELQLGGCADQAGALYVLAGSASGSAPGFPFAGLSIPLNPDDYFLHTLTQLGAPPLLGALGVLDEVGRADAAFTLPPGLPPSLAGLTLHHAYALLDLAPLSLGAVSPAAPVLLAP